jgi:uncharacterized protein (DUF111 family)
VKTGRGYGADKTKAEYEDAAAAAERAGVPFARVWDSVTQTIAENGGERP